MKVEDLLPTARQKLATIPQSAKLTEAAARLGTACGGIVVVCDDQGVLAGVVSKTDIVSRISRCQGCSCAEMVEMVMTREVIHCHADEPLQHAWNRMKEHGLMHIPIVDHEHRPLGVLGARDALQALLGEVEQDETLLRDYVMGIGYR